jgi:hypothetical protein
MKVKNDFGTYVSFHLNDENQFRFWKTNGSESSRNNSYHYIE